MAAPVKPAPAPATFFITANEPGSAAEPAVKVLHDSRESKDLPNGLGGVVTRWTSLSTPADNQGDSLSPADYAGPSVIEHGSHIKVVDLAPGKTIPMHRSSALDYNIVISGEVVLLTPSTPSEIILDVDDPNVTHTVVKAGDCVVQRGTMHAWRNDSSDWVRWMPIIMGARPVVHSDGHELKPVRH